VTSALGNGCYPRRMRAILVGVFAGSVLVAFACGGTSSSATPATTDDLGTDDTGTSSGKKSPSGDDDDDTATDQPVVGYVTLVSTTNTNAGKPSSSNALFAGFSHPYTLNNNCGEKKVDQCTVWPAPQCASKCAAGEACQWKSDCSGAVCVPAPEGTCKDDETFQINANDQWECVRYSDRLDAGRVTIARSGKSTSIFAPDYSEATLSIPYSFAAKYSVMTSGGDVAKFSGTLTTPAELGSNVADLSASVLEPGGSFELTWKKSTDPIVIYVSGGAGRFQCKLEDDPGHFEIGADLLDEARGDSAYVSVGRNRTTHVQDVKATANGKTLTGNVELIGSVVEGIALTKAE